MKLWIATIAISGFVLAAAGCEDPPEETEGHKPSEPLKMAEIRPKPQLGEEMEPQIDEPDAIDFYMWPGSQEGMTFELMWLGGDDEIPLFEEPRDDADIIEMGSWLDGEHFDWTDSVVHVVRPRPYKVEKTQQIAATPYDIAFAELEADELIFELEEGDYIYLYQYGGAKNCYVGIEHSIVLAGCPGDGFRGEDDQHLGDDAGLEFDNKWRPHSQTWWVEVRVDETIGWIRVADAPVEVHHRKIEGYDDSDEYDEFDPLR